MLTSDGQTPEQKRIIFLNTLQDSERAVFENLLRHYTYVKTTNGCNWNQMQIECAAACTVQAWRNGNWAAAVKTKNLYSKVDTQPPSEYPSTAYKDKPKPRQRRAAEGESEQEISNAIAKEMVKLGWLSIRINSGAPQKDNSYFRSYEIKNTGSSAGFPDQIHFKNGIFLLFEVKTETGTLTLSQKDFINLAREHGVKVFVVRSVEDALVAARSVEGRLL